MKFLGGSVGIAPSSISTRKANHRLQNISYKPLKLIGPAGNDYNRRMLSGLVI
jgi:hypothetical protein